MNLSSAILSTLAYHDIFDYPLTKEEIHQYLIGKKSNLAKIQKELAKLANTPGVKTSRHLENTPGVRKGQFRKGEDLYAVSFGRKLFQKRKIRQKYSQSKLKRAQLFSFLLSLIPTVKLVAITGALAMNNSRKNDDIDLLIITSKGTLWTTRFLANLVLLPYKRQPQPRKLPTTNYKLQTNNRACLNIFLDESDLTIRDRNLYTAHEIAQLKPIWDKNKTYSRFIESNFWVNKFLPNWQPTRPVIPAKAGIQHKGKSAVVSHLAFSVEGILKKLQLLYMKKRISTERIGDTQLFFHPSNTQEAILKEYQKRLKRINIPTS